MSAVRVALEIPRTEAEGPGPRYAIWVQGCPLRCPGCCNPELLAERGGDWVDSADLVARIRATPGIEGITLLGGEPFAQAVALADVAEAIRAAGLSVMVFSGHTLAELRQRPDARRLLAATDLLVDGPFARERPDSTRTWIGSENQVMHWLTDRYARDDPRFTAADTVEIRWVDGALTVNGRPWGRGLP